MSHVAPSTGSAAVHYSTLGGGVRSVSWSSAGDRSGRWPALNCSRVPNATAEERRAWCLWSPAADRAAVRGLLNKSRDGLDLSSFSGPRGRTDFCYRNAADAGAYLYTYSAAECAALGLACGHYGLLEQGTYQAIGTPAGAAGFSLAGSYLYVGAWAAATGPAQGRRGSGLYAAVAAAASGGLELRGFFCGYDPADPGLRAACFPETYAFNTQRAACEDGPADGGGWSARLLLSVAAPLAAAALLAAAAAAGCAGACGKAEDESDRLLRAKMAGLRARFRIALADGFVLSTDPPPAWWRSRHAHAAGGAVYLHKSGLEAAARLGLWEDFDIDQVRWWGGACRA
jgi:hypothetical protein